MTDAPSVLRAVRGAITVDADDADAIREATGEMLDEIFARNGLHPDLVVSIFFTMTPDLRAEFPAVAAREKGMSHVALLCATEIDVPGAMGMCIRAMIHCTLPADQPVRHVYLRDARQLRLDLAE
jgi:chorismate mutase